MTDAERYVALTVAERDALVAEVRRLRAEVAQLDAICWALNERTPTTVDAEFGFRVGGRACEHPSLTGGRCDACGWTEAWQADRAANDVRYAANMTDALVSEVRHLRAENERLQAQNTRLATTGNLLLIELEAEADG